MKITPISFLNNKKISATRPLPIKNETKEDVFIKSSNSISFTSKRLAEKFIHLNSQMTDYIIKSKEIDVREIEKIIQKYSPNTSFDDLKNFITERTLTTSDVGFISIPILFSATEDHCEIIEKPKTVYITFPEDSNERNRIILLDRILHECTHLFQEESKDRTSTTEFLNAYLKKTQNLDAALDDIQKLPTLFAFLEKNMFNIILSSNLKIGSLPKEIGKNVTLDAICKKNYAKPTNEIFMYLIMNCLNEIGTKDAFLSLDYIILKANFEKEAYINALKSDKKLTGIKGRTDFDLRIEGYDEIIKAAQNLKIKFKKLELK